MDRSPKKQIRIDLRREEVAARHSHLWADMIAKWNLPGPEDRAWLMYSANYLFRTGEVHWAMDPLTLR
jgi:hypothetical protein